MLLKTVAVNLLVRLSVLSIENPQKGIKQSINIFYIHTNKLTAKKKKEPRKKPESPSVRLIE